MAKLRVHNIESGPASSDVAFGTTGDTIAVSSDSLKLNTWKDSGANTLFQSDGAGTLSNVNAGFSGNGPKLILSQTASSSATVNFTANIDSTYDKYMFVFVNCQPATDGVDFSFQGSTDGGSNYNTTITSTFFEAYHGEADNGAAVIYLATNDQAQGTGYQSLTQTTGSESDQSCSGMLYLYAPSSTTYVKQFYSRVNESDSANFTVDCYAAGYLNTTSAINAVSFKFDSGNINAGKIKMYGIS